MSVACLIVRVGARTSGIPARDVVETMRPLPLIPLPGLPAFVAGISILRGAPVPVVDLARLFGAARGSNDEPARRWVAVRARDRRVALAVDAVLGIEAVDEATLASADPLVTGGGAGFIAAIAARDAELFVVLDAARILPDRAWDALDAEAPRASA